MPPAKRVAPSAGATTSKKRRFVTACSECHRRKQKCNREKPCNFCCSRNVPDRCIYASLNAQNQQSEDVSNPQRSPKQDIPENEDTSPLASITEQVGYSNLSDRNSYTRLQKLIQSHNLQTHPKPTALDPRVYDHLRKTYSYLVKQLPAKTICDELVDVYLNDCNWLYMALESHYFRRIYNDWIITGEFFARTENIDELSRDLQYFPALLFQVLAVAVLFAPPECQCTSLLGLDNLERCHSLSRQYADRAADIMSLLGRSNPTIITVQYEMLRSEWFKHNSRGTEGWHSLGTAIRLGQEIGLHIQADVVQSTETSMEENLERMWYEEYRRRIWARLFVLDSYHAILLGRPRMIHRDDCDFKPLLDCDIPNEPSKVVPIPKSMQNEPSSLSHQICIFDIAHKIHDILSPDIRKPHTLHYHKVKAIHEEVDTILDGIPPHMRPANPDISWDSRKPQFPKCRMHILSTANAFLVNLHRPHVSTQPNSRQAALNAALNALNAQQQLFQLLAEHHYHAYSFWFPTIDIGLFLSSMIIDQPPEDKEILDMTHSALRQAIKRLGKLKSRSNAARTGEQMLKQCYQRIQEIIGSPSITHDDGRGSGTAASETPASDPQFYTPGKQMASSSADGMDIAQLDLMPQFSDLNSIPAPQDFSNDYLSGLWDIGGNLYDTTTAAPSIFDSYMATQMTVNGYMLPPDVTNYPAS